MALVLRSPLGVVIGYFSKEWVGMLWNQWFGIASATAAIGVALGAFAAHGLKSKLSEYHLNVFETGNRYHMYAVIGLLAVSFMATRIDQWQVHAAGYSFLASLLLFSGSLYVLAVTGTGWLGAIAPIGGTAMLLGWLFLTYVCFAA